MRQVQEELEKRFAAELIEEIEEQDEESVVRRLDRQLRFQVIEKTLVENPAKGYRQYEARMTTIDTQNPGRRVSDEYFVRF